MKSRLARLTARKAKLDQEWEDEIRAELESKSLRQVAKDADISYEKVRRIGDRK